jgi:prephenate dehydrogenase
MAPARRALIAGLGLIGGSIGIALRRKGWRIAYLDPNVDDAKNAADERVTELGEADLTIVATPVDVAMDLLRTQDAGRRTTTVCSVMSPFTKTCVAGHPMAGSEQRGLAAARGDLFAGKRWFVDRDEPLVREVIEICGATMHVVDAAEHDRAVAITSHLPQLLSTALAAYAGDVDLRFAGSGLRTFLRLASSDASVWTPIFAANRENIDVDGFLRVVQRVLDGDAEAFARAQELAARLS